MIVVDDRLLIDDWLLTAHDNFAADDCFVFDDACIILCFNYRDAYYSMVEYVQPSSTAPLRLQ